MGINVEQAVDEIAKAVTDLWVANAEAILETGYAPALVYEMREGMELKEGRNKEAWARLTIRHKGTEKRSIGGRLSVNVGDIWLQIFVPQKDFTDALKPARLADKMVRNIRRHSGSVEFFNTRMMETGQEGPQYGVTVQSEFRYDQINNP